jgi:hypothetical protein
VAVAAAFRATTIWVGLQEDAVDAVTGELVQALVEGQAVIVPDPPKLDPEIVAAAEPPGIKACDKVMLLIWGVGSNTSKFML